MLTTQQKKMRMMMSKVLWTMTLIGMIKIMNLVLKT